MSSLKKKIALFFAKRKYFSKNKVPVNFRRRITSAKSFLFILPSTAEEAIIALDIPAYFKIREKEVIVLGHQNILPVALESRMYDTISFNDESFTRLGLPNAELVEKIRKKEFDVVIDLTREENQLNSILANCAKAMLRIGFKKDKSDEFYNLQVANNQNNAEISYRNFLNSIQMF